MWPTWMDIYVKNEEKKTFDRVPFCDVHRKVCVHFTDLLVPDSLLNDEKTQHETVPSFRSERLKEETPPKKKGKK